MTKKKFGEFQGIIDDCKNTEEGGRDEFLYYLQKALLLALKEHGRLNTTQHRYAEERLKRQKRDQAREKLQDRGADK